jgi:hypothetical protein
MACFIYLWKTTFESFELGSYMLCVNMITCLYSPQCCLMYFISVYFLHLYPTYHSIKFGHDKPHKPPLSLEYSSDILGYKCFLIMRFQFLIMVQRLMFLRLLTFLISIQVSSGIFPKMGCNGLLSHIFLSCYSQASCMVCIITYADDRAFQNIVK